MTTTTTSGTASQGGWRVVDIVVAAVLAVAFGVVFWGWNVIWAPLFAGQVNPLAYLVSGMWLVPGVLAMLIIRKPGAAIFAETLAAIVSALLGSVWGLDTVLSEPFRALGPSSSSPHCCTARSGCPSPFWPERARPSASGSTTWPSTIRVRLSRCSLHTVPSC